MSFFDDQYEAWEENDCIGSPTDYDEPYSILAVKADRESQREHKMYGTSRTQYLKKRNKAFKKEFSMSRSQFARMNGNGELRRWNGKYNESLKN